MPTKSKLQDTASEAARKIQSKTYSGLVDLGACEDADSDEVFWGLLVLLNKQHQTIASLENRIAVLERAKRH